MASINYALAQQRAAQSSQNKVITQLENSLYKRALSEFNLVMFFWIFQAIYTFVLDSSPSVRRTVEFQSQKKGTSQSSNGGVIPTRWCSLVPYWWSGGIIFHTALFRLILLQYWLVQAYLNKA